jgi:hypothetical protein
MTWNRQIVIAILALLLTAMLVVVAAGSEPSAPKLVGLHATWCSACPAQKAAWERAGVILVDVDQRTDWKSWAVRNNAGLPCTVRVSGQSVLYLVGVQSDDALRALREAKEGK